MRLSRARSFLSSAAVSQFSDKFKAKVAVEAIKGLKTLAELSTDYKVHPNQRSAWKKQLLTNAPELFPTGKKRQSKSEDEITAPLYEEIGKLKEVVGESPDPYYGRYILS